MSEQRIILANGSRLMQEMLRRVLLKSRSLKIVREASDPRELPALIDQTHPEWVILSLTFDNSVPAWVDTVMASYPAVRFLALAPDGSKIKMKWLEVHEQELNGLSLNELIHILEGSPVSP